MALQRVDPRPRIEFYVRQGLVPRMPSEQALAEVARRNTMAAGPVERIRYYVRNPREIFPGGKPVLQSNAEVYEQGTRAGRDVADERPSPERDARGIDRLLIHAFKFSPLRFGAQTLYNPWNVVPTTGLEIPAKYLIAHLLHTPHPTALWDVQVLHPDPGALDDLERGIEACAAGRWVRWRLFRAMAPRPGYFEYLASLVQRVRRFDYPETPAGLDPTYDNLVLYLNAAAELT